MIRNIDLHTYVDMCQLQLNKCIVVFHTGSSLSKCTFNGQQCCNKFIISLVDQGFRSLVKSDHFNFTSGLSAAQTAIDQLRNKTDGTAH